MFYFRSELAIAYPDELTGEVAQAKRDGGTKMFQNENKYIPLGYTTATDK